MSIFKASKKKQSEQSADDPLPISPIDFTKRYDIYCSYMQEERLYENMRIVSIRTMEKPRPYGGSVIGGYVEIEALDGKRVMVPHIHIHMLCEHGLQPSYKLLRTGMHPEKGVGREG